MLIVHIEKQKAHSVLCGLADERVKLSARDRANAVLRARHYDAALCKRCERVLEAQEKEMLR